VRDGTIALVSNERDPIAELVEAMARDGRPSLAWVLRWSAGGVEPVAAAWHATRDSDSMESLLARARPSSLAAATNVLERELGPGWYHRNASEIAPVLRRAVPVPPTLGDLLRRR
jgi:hypothetical protein